MEKRLSLTIDPSNAKRGADDLNRILTNLERKAKTITDALNRVGDMDKLSKQVTDLEAKVRKFSSGNEIYTDTLIKAEQALQRNYSSVKLLNTEVGKELELSKKMVANKKLEFEATSKEAKAVEAATSKTKAYLKLQNDLVKTKERLALVNTKEYKELQKVRRELDSAERSAKGLDTQTRSLQRTLMGVGIAASMFSGTMIAEGMLRTLDTYTEMENRLAVVTGSTEGLTKAMQDLLEVSIASRSSLQATTDLYAKLNRVSSQYDMSQQEVLRLTETVAKAVAMSGASAAATEGAIIQFGQALANNFSAAGQELNSINEQTPALAQAIAKAITATGKLGVVAQSDLKRLASEGKITTEIILEGMQLISSHIDDQAAKATKTMAQAWQNLTDSVTLTAGQLDDFAGVSDSVISSLEELTDIINNDKGLVAGFAGFTASVALLATGGTLIALVGLIGLATSAIGALVLAGAGIGSYLTVKFFEAEIRAEQLVSEMENVEGVAKRLDELKNKPFTIISLDEFNTKNAESLRITLEGIKTVRDDLEGDKGFENLVDSLRIEGVGVDQQLLMIANAVGILNDKLEEDPKSTTLLTLKEFLKTRQELLKAEKESNELFKQGFGVLKIDPEDNENLRNLTNQVEEYIEALKTPKDKAIEEFKEIEKLLENANKAGVNQALILELRTKAQEKLDRVLNKGTKSSREYSTALDDYMKSQEEQLKILGMNAYQAEIYRAEQEALRAAEEQYEQQLKDGVITREQYEDYLTNAAYRAGILTAELIKIRQAQDRVNSTSQLSVGNSNLNYITNISNPYEQLKAIDRAVELDQIQINDELIQTYNDLNKEIETLKRSTAEQWDVTGITTLKNALRDIDNTYEKGSEEWNKQKAMVYSSFFEGAREGLQQAIATSDWSGLRQGVGSAFADAIGQSVQNNLTKSLQDSFSKMAGEGASDMFGDMLGGALGAFGGAAVGGLVGGILAGSKTEMTGEGYRIGLEAGEVFSAEFSKSFKKSSIFGTKRWTEYSNMLLAETDALSNTFEKTISTITRDANALGVSLEEYSGTLENKNGDLAEANEDLANIYANSGLAALEKYQELGETAADTFTRLASDAQNITESFKVIGTDIRKNRNEWAKEFAKELTETYTSEMMSNLTTQADMQRKLNELNKVNVIHKDGDYYLKKDLEESIGVLTDNYQELSSRLPDVYEEAAVEFDQRLKGTIAKLKNVNQEDAGQVLSQLTNSFAENYLTETERLQNTMRYAKQEFLSLGFSEDDLNASVDTVKAFYEAATSPEDRANALVAADALARYNNAMEALAEELSEFEEALKNVAETASNAAEKMLDISKNNLLEALEVYKDSIDAQIESITQAAEAERELLDIRLNSSKDAVSYFKSLKEVASESIDSVTNRNSFTRSLNLLDSVLLGITTGDRVDTGVVSDAVSGFASLGSDNFSSAFEKAYQSAIIATRVASIESEATVGLTTEELMLAALEDQIKLSEETEASQIKILEEQYSEMERQVNVLLGIDNSVKSVAEALSSLKDAMFRFTETESLTETPTKTPEQLRPMVTDDDIQWTINTTIDRLGETEEAWQFLYNRAKEFGVDIARIEKFLPGSMSWVSSQGLPDTFTTATFTDADIEWAVNDIINRHKGLTDNAGKEIYNLANESNVSLNRVLPYLGISQEDLEVWLSNMGLPMFSTGGYTGKSIGLVHPEEYVLNAEATKALGKSNLDYMNTTGSMPLTPPVISYSNSNNQDTVTRELIREVRELRNMMRQDTDNTDRMQRILRKWDIQGQPATRDQFV